MHKIPRILMITGSYASENETFFEKLIYHIKNGVKLIQLREKQLDMNEYLFLAEKVVEAGKIYGATVILNADIDIVEKLNADGVHLNSAVLMKTKKRPLPENKIIFAACHDKEQLLQAKRIGVDFVTLSPVMQTNSHLDATPLGWENFSELCKSIDIPVYALGGLAEKDLDTAMSCGAYGVAAIGSLWNNKYK